MDDRATIPPELISQLEGGAAVWAATCDAQRIPEPTRVTGTRVRDNGRALTLYLPTVQAERAIRNLREVPEVAVFFVTLTDYRAVQVKGEVVAVRETKKTERKYPEGYLAAFIPQTVAVGMARELGERMIFWPSTAVEVAVRELYQQTPGLEAGKPWR